jgi:hypothetical protein
MIAGVIIGAMAAMIVGVIVWAVLAWKWTNES